MDLPSADLAGKGKGDTAKGKGKGGKGKGDTAKGTGKGNTAKGTDKGDTAKAKGKGKKLHRWMVHRRTDEKPWTMLRSAPVDSKKAFMKDIAALQGEIVEVLSRVPENGFVRVQLALGGQEGWLRENLLQISREGTDDHGRTSAGDKMKRTKLEPGSFRFREIQHLIRDSWCVKGGCTLKCSENDTRPKPSGNCLAKYTADDPWEIKEVTFLEGQCLGVTGLVKGPKSILFHGCKDETVDAILETGFDLEYTSNGAFGKGCYFTPQACKAFSYSYDGSVSPPKAGSYLLICEVALGSPDQWHVFTDTDPDFNKEALMKLKPEKRCGAHFAGAVFAHEERVIYHNTQCKPVYVVKMKHKSPAFGK